MSYQRQVRNFEAPHGTVQIVELADGECQVGYLSKDTEKELENGTATAKWLHWGLGEGGYDATVERFKAEPTFNPDADPLQNRDSK